MMETGADPGFFGWGGGGGGGQGHNLCKVSNMKWRGVWGPPMAPEALHGGLGDRIMIQSNFGRVFFIYFYYLFIFIYYYFIK